MSNPCIYVHHHTSRLDAVVPIERIAAHLSLKGIIIKRISDINTKHRRFNKLIDIDTIKHLPIWCFRLLKLIAKDNASRSSVLKTLRYPRQLLTYLRCFSEWNVRACLSIKYNDSSLKLASHLCDFRLIAYQHGDYYCEKQKWPRIHEYGCHALITWNQEAKDSCVNKYKKQAFYEVGAPFFLFREIKNDARRIQDKVLLVESLDDKLFPQILHALVSSVGETRLIFRSHPYESKFKTSNTVKIPSDDRPLIADNPLPLVAVCWMSSGYFDLARAGVPCILVRPDDDAAETALCTMAPQSGLINSHEPNRLIELLELLLSRSDARRALNVAQLKESQLEYLDVNEALDKVSDIILRHSN